MADSQSTTGRIVECALDGRRYASCAECWAKVARGGRTPIRALTDGMV
jgi:hypothetical protein